jgi:hypothetical protein
MVARYCVKCEKMSDDPVCSRCGRVTDPVNLCPPWLDDYEVDQTEVETHYPPKVYVGDGQYQ